MNIDRAHLQNIILPPIQLYEVGGCILCGTETIGYPWPACRELSPSMQKLFP
jgi:hypothetical protein